MGILQTTRDITVLAVLLKRSSIIHRQLSDNIQKYIYSILTLLANWHTILPSAAEWQTSNSRRYIKLRQKLYWHLSTQPQT